ncbi:MAG: hypothetical protein ABI605_11400 [Rhizobacter sp.]
MNMSNDTHRPLPDTVGPTEQHLQITPFHAEQLTCIHATTLSALLTEPGAIGTQLCQGIGEKLAPMGFVVHAVELQGVSLPEDMDADNDMRLLLEMNLRLSRHRLERVAEGIRQQLQDAAQASQEPAMLRAPAR